ADAEILALLAESLERCGLSVCEPTLQVGNIRLVNALFGAVPDETRAEILQALRQGDVPRALGRARDAAMPEGDLERANRALTGIRVDGVDKGELCRVIELARERWPGKEGRWGAPNAARVLTTARRCAALPRSARGGWQLHWEMWSSVPAAPSSTRR